MMQSRLVWISRAAALMVAGVMVANPVFADKPSGTGGGKKQEARDDHGGGKNGKNGKNNERKDDRGGQQSDRNERHFGDHQHVIVRDYYVQQQSAGHCPPGLAKKNNGCMPPGQAKKWHKGQPLPRDVVFYNLPPTLVVQLGAPPSGHRYVRVASDILLIAIGTGMVVDAIADLGRM